MFPISDPIPTDLGPVPENDASEDASAYEEADSDETAKMTPPQSAKKSRESLDDLAVLAPLPPSLADDEAVEETSDDDYVPMNDFEGEHRHLGGAYVDPASDSTAEGRHEGEDADGEEREATEDLSAPFVSHAANEGEHVDFTEFLAEKAKILVESVNHNVVKDDETVHEVKIPEATATYPETATVTQEIKEEIREEKPTLTSAEQALSPLLSPEAAQLSQAEKDHLISQFISAKAMELTAHDDRDIEELNFGDIKASKARRAALERNNFANARKFMFDAHFDPVLIPTEGDGAVAIALEGEPLPPPPEPEPPPPPPPPSFSEEELAAARAVAWSEGEAAGRNAARQEINHALSQNLQILAENITQLLAEREQQINHFGAEASKIAQAMVGKLFPELARRGGITEIEALMHNAVELARERAKLTLTLAPHLREALEPKLTTLAQAHGFDGQIVFLSDATMGDADVRIEWGDGGIERLTGRTWQSINDVMERLNLAHP